ncbi:hypothetical protein PvNV_018 [Penaeus vannamei nudivirus]|nr:hypothetical protein PvSNPV_018 [Penaeus vannamei nucleopolyhedrovirus]
MSEFETFINAPLSPLSPSPQVEGDENDQNVANVSNENSNVVNAEEVPEEFVADEEDDEEKVPEEFVADEDDEEKVSEEEDVEFAETVVESDGTCSSDDDDDGDSDTDKVQIEEVFNIKDFKLYKPHIHMIPKSDYYIAFLQKFIDLLRLQNKLKKIISPYESCPMSHDELERFRITPENLLHIFEMYQSVNDNGEISYPVYGACQVLDGKVLYFKFLLRVPPHKCEFEDMCTFIGNENYETDDEGFDVECEDAIRLAKGFIQLTFNPDIFNECIIRNVASTARDCLNQEFELRNKGLVNNKNLKYRSLSSLSENAETLEGLGRKRRTSSLKSCIHKFVTKIAKSNSDTDVHAAMEPMFKQHDCPQTVKNNLLKDFDSHSSLEEIIEKTIELFVEIENQIFRFDD